jgi:hypothetical protein
MMAPPQREASIVIAGPEAFQRAAGKSGQGPTFLMLTSEYHRRSLASD